MSMVWLNIKYARHLLHEQTLQRLDNELWRESVLLSEKLQQIQQDMMFLVDSRAVKSIIGALQVNGDKKTIHLWKQHIETMFRTMQHQQQAYEQISFIGIVLLTKAMRLCGWSANGRISL